MPSSIPLRVPIWQHSCIKLQHCSYLIQVFISCFPHVECLELPLISDGFCLRSSPLRARSFDMNVSPSVGCALTRGTSPRWQLQHPSQVFKKLPILHSRIWLRLGNLPLSIRFDLLTLNSSIECQIELNSYFTTLKNMKYDDKSVVKLAGDTDPSSGETACHSHHVWGSCESDI